MGRLAFNKEIRIKRLIGDDHPVFIIAEAGVNHGGDMDLARRLVDVAVEAGADAVKFQAFRTEELILENVEKAGYQKDTTGETESQYEMLKKLELRRGHYLELKEYCESKGIVFLITPFDETSLEELEEIDVDAFKVASTDTTNLPFLKKIAQTGKPVILSTGMTYMNEVEMAMNELHSINQDVLLMQCTANYPILDEEANLNVLRTYARKFDCILGYSDHSVGLGASPFAIPLGARIIEKHFTIDKDAEGPDHRASLDPIELKEYVELVRRVEKFLGSEEKKPTASEELTRKSLQKCLVTSGELPVGHILSESDFRAKRTGGSGVSPIRYKELIGRTVRVPLKENVILLEEHLA